jgi:SNF2 family DNA or RNA helicase
VPRYLTGVDLEELTDLCREGAGGLYDFLLPHQKNTVRGMFCQAANRWTNGLILADQTGLGKLVQTVALAAAVETYCHKVARKTDFSGVLFVFPTAIYDAQLTELHE